MTTLRGHRPQTLPPIGPPTRPPQVPIEGPPEGWGTSKKNPNREVSNGRHRRAWLRLGYQREFCTATTSLVCILTRNMLRHNGIHLGIASAARTLRLKAGLNDDRGREGARG